MKQLLIVVILILPLALWAQIHTDKPERQKLNGKVKTIKYSSVTLTESLHIDNIPYTLDTSFFWGSRFISNWYWIDSFNTAGLKVVEYQVKDSIRSLIETIEYEFDNYGRVIVEIRNDPKNNVTRRNTYKYDTTGNIVKQQRFYNGRMIFSTKCVYDSSKLMQKEDSTNQGLYKTIFKYRQTTLRKEIEELSYNPVGQKSIKYSYYDDNGNLVSEILHSGQKLRPLYEYDKNNNLVKEIYYGANDSVLNVYTHEYIYDEQKNWILKLEEFADKNANGQKIILQRASIRLIDYY